MTLKEGVLLSVTPFFVLKGYKLKSMNGNLSVDFAHKKW